MEKRVSGGVVRCCKRLVLNTGCRECLPLFHTLLSYDQNLCLSLLMLIIPLKRCSRFGNTGNLCFSIYQTSRNEQCDEQYETNRIHDISFTRCSWTELMVLYRFYHHTARTEIRVSSRWQLVLQENPFIPFRLVSLIIRLFV